MKRFKVFALILSLGFVAYQGQARPRFTPKQIGHLGAAAEQNYANGNTALANKQAALHNQGVLNYTTHRPNGFVANQVRKGNQFIGQGLK